MSNFPPTTQVGYGLDYDGAYRSLPFVGELRPDVVNPTNEPRTSAAIERNHASDPW